MINSYTLSLTCLFCDTVLEGDTDREYKEGDFIKCQNCGMENEYSSLMKIVEEKAIRIAKNEVAQQLENIFK